MTYASWRKAMSHSPASASQAPRFEPRSEADTRLYGTWLVPARTVCLSLSGVNGGPLCRRHPVVPCETSPALYGRSRTCLPV